MDDPSDFTVGQVSGMIAAAVFIVQIWIPIALPIILIGLLRFRSKVVTETAVTWSVVGRFLHSTYWPTILGTDSASTFSANKTTILIISSRVLMVLLVAIAAIVTPLGLYESIEASKDVSTTSFHYIQDSSIFGLGTPPRSNSSGTWSRICGFNFPSQCPNSPNNMTTTRNTTGTYIDTGTGYSSRIPQDVVDVFESGLSTMEASISGPFDIQYRSYIKSELDPNGKGLLIDNGTTPYTKGVYRPLSSVIFYNEFSVVEGLVVDMKSGGIGFRNHSAPALDQFGSTWSENILFISPETECVNTNLTLDFAIPATKSEYVVSGLDGVFNLALTDRGGFVNINHTYPEWNKENTQQNPELKMRAYNAAWINNAMTMLFLNVSNLSNQTTEAKVFSYLNSSMDKSFPLHYSNGETIGRGVRLRPTSLQISTMFGEYLNGADKGQPNTTSIDSEATTYNFNSKEPVYTNPFNVGTSGSRYNNFSIASLNCVGAGGRDLANITNIIASCGLMYGAPERVDGGASLLFDPGSTWKVPMYSCISTVKASIKTVGFSFNRTNDLSGIAVTSLEDKKYQNEKSMPLWAVEQSEMLLSEGNPLWGIVTEESAKKLNVSTLRKESLYLPGYVGTSMGMLSSHQNLPSTDFASIALASAYNTGSIGSSSKVDYSGESSLAMYRLWQKYSHTPDTSSKIINLIWTDIATNMVLGTRGLHTQKLPPVEKRANTPPDSSSNRAVRHPFITSYNRRIRYQYLYGIPGFLTLLLTAVLGGATIFFFLYRAQPSVMRTFLESTSSGRFLTAQTGKSHARDGSNGSRDKPSRAPTRAWVREAGKAEFTLGPDGWSNNAKV